MHGLRVIDQSECDAAAVGCEWMPKHNHALAILAMVLEMRKDINSVLDVGCHDGRILLQLREMFPRLTIRGVEPNQTAANACKQRGLEVDAAFIEDLPYETSDLVASLFAIHYFDDMEEGTKVLFRRARKMVVVGEELGDQPWLFKSVWEWLRFLCPTEWRVAGVTAPNPLFFYATFIKRDE